MLPHAELIISGLIITAVAYLLGSLPFSLWIGRGLYGIDVREHGSGNAGATNTWRVLGWKAGLPVLILDILKGLGATFLPFFCSALTSDPDLLLWGRVMCGIAAAVGHIFPVFAGFRGGKAVATLLGVSLGLMPVAASASLLVFLLVFLTFRIVSLGSVMAGISLPLMALLFTDKAYQLIFYSLLIGILVLITHTKNIGRLVRGGESKIRLLKREKDTG
jgi:glycerol-3-phosphate acyltransferase PlsY